MIMRWLCLVMVVSCLVGCRSAIVLPGRNPRGAKPPPANWPPGAAMPTTNLGQPHVTIQGEVRNPVIAWTNNLTLSAALLAAEFIGPRDPQTIVIFRQGQAIRVETRHLLGGIKDPTLEPGDAIELRK